MKKVFMAAFVLLAALTTQAYSTNNYPIIEVKDNNKDKSKKEDKKYKKALAKIEKKKTRLAKAENKRLWRKEQANQRAKASDRSLY